MTETTSDSAPVREFHAQVHHQPNTRAHAAHLRSELGDRSEVRLGRWHDALVGPHTRSMYQVAFAAEDVADHSAHALWLGDRLELRLEVIAAHRNPQ